MANMDGHNRKSENKPKQNHSNGSHINEGTHQHGHHVSDNSGSGEQNVPSEAEQPTVRKVCSDVLSTSSSSSNSTPYSHARNKSPNPLSHIGASHKSKNSHTYDNVPESVHAHHSNFPSINASATKGIKLVSTSMRSIPGTDLELGSMVEVSTELLDNLNGVIRWIGLARTPTGEQTLVGVELENELLNTPLDVTDGMYRGQRLFHCPPGRGVFVDSMQCTADSRFGDPDPIFTVTDICGSDEHMVRRFFGGVDCPVVEGIHEPMNIMTSKELSEICGSFKGIQGHLNSCYLDATLFGMFAFTRVFDSALYQPTRPDDLERYAEVQTCLRDEIINPLRTNKFVRADRVMKLRQMLGEICLVKGMTDEEKDPEEFLNLLMVTVLKVDPPLQLNTGQASFCYQLFVTPDPTLVQPTVQQLFDQSFLEGDTKLQQVPQCLIVQMPRFGKSYKMYSRVLPSLLLDITDAIQNSPRQCAVCGRVANLECKDCFNQTLESTSFCNQCYMIKHQQFSPKHCVPKELLVPEEYVNAQIRGQESPPRIFMDLFAVVCIETSHYVSFVKTGSGENAPWCFFDSMADRKGGQGGHNVPELTSVEQLPHWISEEGNKELEAIDDRQLPKLARRLLCDAYLCMYQSRELMMYK